MGRRTRVMKIGQNVQQLAQCFHTSGYNTMWFEFSVYILMVVFILFFLSVSDMCDKNLMKPSNLAVCFGPTLMRPEHETVASIVDIRYQNIIVETMIKHVDEVNRCTCTCSHYISN